MSDAENPYLGRTRQLARPVSNAPACRAMTHTELRLAQAQWDAANTVRMDEANEVYMAEMTETRYSEELASKALENRLRTQFLSRKGATMQEWLAERDAILARATNRPSDD